LRDSSEFEAVRARLDGDPRLSLEAKRENFYYAEQSRAMAKFLRILGLSLTSIFSIGAVIGAMITMYSAVANRTGEIGTLRALGYQRRSILAAFLVEALLLGFFGGVAGVFFASFMQLITVSTMNFQTFAELAFSFTLSPAIVAESMAFAFVMGFVGGVLPARRASRMNIVESLRAP
jgi:ABC-type antimicrobial peptide transport system permease subunit